MLRTIALILLPLVLLAAACGGSSDGATRESDDDAVEAVGPAGADGIYNTADDNEVGDESDRDDPANDPADPPASVAEPDGVVGADDDGAASTTGTDGGGDDILIAEDGSGPEVGSSSLENNAFLGALNPLSFISGMIPDSSGQGSVDPELGAALLTAADVPGGFQEMGEFSFSIPSEFGNMDMAARMFATGDDPDDFGAMIMSVAMTLPPEAMGELDELMGLTEADFAEVQQASDDFGMEFADLQILNADGLGDGGFGMHMEIDFGALFSVFGAPEDDSVPAGIAMDIYAFAAGEKVLMVMVMWPTGEPLGVDALALAEIMASRT